MHTSADYDRVFASVYSGRAIEFEDYGVVSAALRIASRVMTEGVIGAALFADWDGEEPDRSAEEAAVRAALLGDAGR